MAVPHFRIGHAAAPVAHVLNERAVGDLGCDSLYLEPTANADVNATSPVTFKWDTSCQIGAEKIDLYLYCPALTSPLIKQWSGIDFSAGQFEVQMQPNWWNNTDNATLYTNIGITGQAWATSWPPGPLFTVHYEMKSMFEVYTSNGVVMTSTKPGASTQTSNTVFEHVGAIKPHSVSKAIIAVAVVIPLVVIGILAAVAFYFYRLKEKEKLKRWSHALSQHSNMEWEKGALPGERISSSYTRPSSHYSRASQGRPSTGYGRPGSHYSRASQGRPSTGYGRPASSVIMENMAGAGAGGFGAARTAFPHGSSGDLHEPVRSSHVMPNGEVRQSRVSFADSPRPRVSFNDSRPSFTDTRPHVSSNLAADAHAAAVYASGSAIDENDGPGIMSPTQMDGPHDVSDADMSMAAAAAGMGQSSPPRGSPPRDPYSGLAPEEHVEALDAPRAASPSVTSPTGTVAYGPDQMLAVYAARGKVNNAPRPASPVVAAPVAPAAPAPPPSAMPNTKAPGAVRRFLSRKDSKTRIPDSRGASTPSPEPMSMRSYVHLHNGTVPSIVVDSLPPPGPPGTGADGKFDDAEEHHGRAQ